MSTFPLSCIPWNLQNWKQAPCTLDEFPSVKNDEMIFISLKGNNVIDHLSREFCTFPFRLLYNIISSSVATLEPSVSFSAAIVGASFKEATPRNQSIKFNIYTPASDQSARRRGGLETVVREGSSQWALEPLAQSARVNDRWSFEWHIIHVHATFI